MSKTPSDGTDLPVGMMGESDEHIAAFRKMVASGESPRMAEMLALRKAPKPDTDTSHFAGMGLKQLAKHVGEVQVRKIEKQARQAGISINDNSIYNASVADRRQAGDPNAWLLAGDGRDKFKKVIRNRGGTCESLGIEKVDGGAFDRHEIRKVNFKKNRSKVAQRQQEMADKVKA